MKYYGDQYLCIFYVISVALISLIPLQYIINYCIYYLDQR